MSTLHDEVLHAVFSAVDEINQFIPKEKRIAKSKDVVLSGSAGELDSLGFINFLVTTEQKIEDKFGKTVSLTDIQTMSQANTPFRNIGTLVDYISSFLQNSNG